ncbi:hypothetical protein BY996DRAFT_6703468, partial [Phakopsora pachyrhizi]
MCLKMIVVVVIMKYFKTNLSCMHWVALSFYFFLSFYSEMKLIGIYFSIVIKFYSSFALLICLIL